MKNEQRTLSSEILEELSIGYTHSEIVRNPYSGQEILLDPIAVAVYDYLKGCEMFNYWEELQRARNWFIDNRPNAYYILID